MVQQVTVLLQYTTINTPCWLNKWRLVIDYIVSDSRSIDTALREPQLRDWSLITGRGGATKWENRGSETFCTPPLKTG